MWLTFFKNLNRSVKIMLGISPCSIILVGNVYTFHLTNKEIAVNHTWVIENKQYRERLSGNNESLNYHLHA